MTSSSRRRFLQGAAVSPLALALMPRWSMAQQGGGSVTIAYNVKLPSWDPTVGLSAVNPTIQSIYRSVFTPFIDQNPDLSFKPGILTSWGWNKNRTKIELAVRNNAYWHDGSRVTADDVAWSLARAGKTETGNPIQFIWSKIGNIRANGNTVTADVLEYEPALFKWMAFLTGYVMPRRYYEKVGPQGFEEKPIGSGPYMLERFARDEYVRLKAFERYHGGKSYFRTAIFRLVPDASSRVAQLLSGEADVALEVPYEDYNRLVRLPQFVGTVTPVSDIAMIFLNDNYPVMQDKNVRLAAAMAINKKLIVNRLLRGYGLPIDTLQAPEYAAFDPAIKVPYDPEQARALLARSGYSTKNPARFKVQTTRGFKPKDYEMMNAIVGMWKRVGIEAEIEVYEIAQHFELRARDALAPAAFYNWGNAIGDPSTSTGFSMFGPSPHSTWDTDDLDAMIAPLWTERDEAKRIAGYKKVDRYIAEQAYVIPLFQYVQPIVHLTQLKVTPHVANFLLPQAIRRA